MRRIGFAITNTGPNAIKTGFIDFGSDSRFGAETPPDLLTHFGGIRVLRPPKRLNQESLVWREVMARTIYKVLHE